MKTLSAFLALCSACIGNPTVLHNGQVIVKDNVGNQIAIVPFAAPISVPVATVQPGGTYYSQGHDIAQLVAEVQALRAEVQSLKNGAQALSKPSLVTTACASCHGGNGKKTALDQWTLADMETSDGRLRAIRAVLTDKMPKGKKLNPQEAGALLRELSGPAVAKTQDVPPSPPKPEEER